MQDPIDNRIINEVTSVTIEHYLLICIYQNLLSDFKLGNKSIDCKTQTKELISGRGPSARAGRTADRPTARF